MVSSWLKLLPRCHWAEILGLPSATMGSLPSPLPSTKERWRIVSGQSPTRTPQSGIPYSSGVGYAPAPFAPSSNVNSHSAARSKSAPDPGVAITAVGEATAVLPVVSTLIFVFAMESIFQSNFDIAANPADIAVLILLSMAAALSLYTTTFSVLECELRHSRFCSRTLGTNSLALLFVFSLLY